MRKKGFDILSVVRRCEEYPNRTPGQKIKSLSTPRRGQYEVGFENFHQRWLSDLVPQTGLGEAKRSV